MERIVWKRPNNVIAITLWDESSITEDLPTPEAYAAMLLNRSEYAGWELLGINIPVPEDRSFRPAWRHTDGVIDVDIDAAKELTKDRLRAERAPLFEALDVDFMRAMEQGKDTSAIVAEKQRLRDATKVVDSINTVEELKAVTIDTVAVKGVTA